MILYFASKIAMMKLRNNFNLDTSGTNRKNLKIAVILGYILIALNVVSGIILLPLITGSLGQSGYGIYSAASSLVSMFLIDLGLSNAATRFISRYRVLKTQKDIDSLISVIWRCFFIITGVIAILFVIFYFCLQFIYRSFTDFELSQFHIVYIMIVVSSVFCFPFNVIGGVLVAYDKAYLTRLSDIISKIIFIVATVVCIVFNLGLYFMTACYLLHSITAVLLKIIFSIKTIPLSPFVKVDKQTFKTILKDVLAYSIWTSISTYARTLMLSFMTTILGVTSPEGEGSAQIAIYSIAYQIETYVSYFSTSFGTIFYPEVSRRLYAGGQLTEENKKNFGTFNLKVAHIQTIILFIVCAGLLLCGNEFLQLWLVGDLKANHETIYFCILAICSTAIFLYPLQVLETALNTSGYIKYQALANLVGSIVAIALAFLLSYYWGAFGCCVAIAIGTVVRIIMLNIFGHKFIAFRIGEYHLKTYASFIIPGAITIVFGLIIYKFLPQVSWLYFIIKVVAISAVYAISLSIFGLNKYERDKTLGFLKKFERKIKSLTGKVME